MGAICAVYLLPFFLLPFTHLLPESVAGAVAGSGPVRWLNRLVLTGEYAMRDTLVQNGRRAEVHPDLVFVCIDSSSLKLDHLGEDEIAASPALTRMAQSWPWPRDVYAMILDRLFASGARLVAIDLLFPLPSPTDPAFAAALEKYRDRVVMAGNFVISRRGNQVYMTYDLPAETLLPLEESLRDRAGYVNYFPDYFDNVVRRMSVRKMLPGQEDHPVESFPARILNRLGKPELIPEGDAEPMFRWAGPAGTYVPIPACQLFDERIWVSNLRNGDVFRDKIVVLGPEGNWSQDEHMTPLGLMPGPEVHLNALGALLSGELMRDTPAWVDFLLVIAAAAAAFLLVALVRTPWICLPAIGGLAAFHIWVLQVLHDHHHLFTTSFAPVFVLVCGGVSCLAYEFVLEQIERRRTRHVLERYISKDLVRDVLDNPQTYFNTLGGVRKPVTVLFSDVRGFTSMAENADPSALVRQLNEYLAEMVRAVFDHHGSVDKFIGDAVMAVWGNVRTEGAAADAVHAVRSALAMRRALAALNARWRAQGRKELSIGIGINHGDVIVGNVGSEQKMEITVIGDAVNLASRLEGLTKEYHCDLLVGESVAALVRDQFHLRAMALVRVKGKTQPVEIFSVLDEKTGSPPAWLEAHEAGVACYRKREFSEALARFQRVLEERPDDFIAGRYARECAQLRDHPPGEDWDGVITMTSK